MRRYALAVGLTAILAFSTGAPMLAADEPGASPATPATQPSPGTLEEPAVPITHVLDPPGNKSFGGWTELGRMPVQSGDGTEIYFESLAALGDRLVLLTVRYPIEGGRSTWVPWYSDDGVTWTESALPDDARQVTDMASTPDGIIASGVAGTRDERRARIWTTSDGVEWTTASAPPIPKISRILTTDPLTVLGSGSGMWSTPDGESWEALGKHPAYTVEAGPGGFLSAGGGGQDRVTPTVLWRSPDGRKWSQVRLPRVLREGHPAFGEIQVLSVGSKWVLIPKEKAPESIFVSKDGKRWRRVPRPTGMQGGWVWWMERVGKRVQAYGIYDDRRPALWTWKLGRAVPRPEGTREMFMDQPVRWGGGHVATGETSDTETLVLWHRR